MSASSIPYFIIARRTTRTFGENAVVSKLALRRTRIPIGGSALLVSLLEIVEHRYDAWRRSGLAPLLDELESRNVLRGRRVEVGGEAGTAGSIAADGRLTLERDDGSTVLVGSGEVQAQQLD